jgi:hypothetical protein
MSCLVLSTEALRKVTFLFSLLVGQGVDAFVSGQKARARDDIL